MDIYSMLIESSEKDDNVNELNLGITQHGRNLKRADKETKRRIDLELENMKVELLTYMKHSGSRRATPDLVKSYLNRKGLGDIGDEVVDEVVSQVVSKNQGPGAIGMGDEIVGDDGITYRRVGAYWQNTQTNKIAKRAVGAKLTQKASQENNSTGNPTSDSNEPIPRRVKPEIGKEIVGDDGMTYRWMGAVWKNTQTGKVAKREVGAKLTQKASQQNNSMYEASDNQVTLSKRQVTTILKQVIAKAYSQNASFSRSRFSSSRSSRSRSSTSRNNNNGTETAEVQDFN